jgi:hypothetical protein
LGSRDVIGSGGPERAAPASSGPEHFDLACVFRGSKPRPSSPAQRLVAAAAFVLATAAVLLRQTGTGALDTIWAEDGSIFLPRALEASPGSVLLEPAVGYVHLVPRLLADVASLFPLAAAPYVMSGGGAMVLAALSLFVFHVSGSYLTSRWVRVALAASVVLLPAGGAEAFNNTALLHFFLMYATFWALVWVPPTRAGIAVSCLVAFLAATSDPLTVVLAPVVIARVWYVRTWRQHLVTLCLAGGLLVQLAVIMTADAARELPASAAGTTVVAWFVWYVLVVAVFGERLLPEGLDPVALGLVLGAGLVWLGVLVLAWRRRWDHRVVLALLAAGVGGLLYVTPVVAAGTHTPRYAVAPVLLFTVALFAILDALPPRLESSLQGIATMAIVLAVATAWTSSYLFANQRTSGVSWSDELASAQVRCAEAEPLDEVEIPITPPGWTMVVACIELR